jgi:cell division protein FtsI (penicillin-binding protein 3)
MSLEMEPMGRAARARGRQPRWAGASLFAVVFLVIAVRLVAITLLPDGAEAATVPTAKVKTDRADIADSQRRGARHQPHHRLGSMPIRAWCRSRRDRADAELRAAGSQHRLDRRRSTPTAASSGWKRNRRRASSRRSTAWPAWIYFQAETKRVYPQGSLTAHLVGFTDVDSRGLAGVERSFDDLLQGERARCSFIDVRVQHILHEELTAPSRTSTASAAPASS